MKKAIAYILAAACAASLAACAGQTREEPGGSDATVIFEDTAEERALAGMSLRQKAAQVVMASCHETGGAERAAAFGVGALCLYSDAFQGKTRAEVRGMTAALQSAAALPLLISVDEEGGSVCRVSTNPLLRAEPFKAPLELLSEGGTALLESDTAEKSALLLSLGVNVNLAPVCDVPLSESDYIYERSFGLDARTSSDCVRLVVGEMKSAGIGCALKHFPGYGGSADTHKGLAYDRRSYSDFEASDFLPFEAGVAAGADAVLVSHNIVECMDAQLPASLSPEVHRILRDELGFEGVAISDDMFMDAIRQFTGGENAAVQAFLAGNDLICCGDFEQSAAAIEAAVKDGTIAEARLDASVLRVLAWKARLGLDISAK